MSLWIQTNRQWRNWQKSTRYQFRKLFLGIKKPPEIRRDGVYSEQNKARMLWYGLCLFTILCFG